MALTIPQLAFSLRIVPTSTSAVDTSVAAELTRLQGMAKIFIGDYVGTAAPEAVTDEAERVFVAYMYDGPDFNPGGAGIVYVNAFRNSGAQALLSRWRVHRAGLIGIADAITAGAAGGGIDQAAVDARITALVAAWALAGQERPSGGGSGGGGLSVQDVQALIAGALTESQEFEAALRVSADLVRDASVTIAIANAASRLPTASIPAAEGDRELVVRVGTGLHHRFDLAELMAKPAAAQSAMLSAQNAVTWRDGDDTYYLAREGGAGSRFLFSADTINTVAVTLTDSRVDLQPEARRSASMTLRELIAAVITANVPALARSTIAAAVQGDVTLAASGQDLNATLKQNNIDPADLRFDAGTLVAARLVRINAAASAFEGVDANTLLGGGRIQVFDGSPAGMAITGRNLLTPNPNVLDDTIDIDAAGWHSGEWHYELRATISNRVSATNQASANTISFTQGDATDTEQEASGIVFTSALRAQDTWVSGGATEGTRIVRLPIYYTQFSPSTIQRNVGVLTCWFVTQVVGGAKRVRFVTRYDPSSLVNFTFNISFSLKLSLTRSDPGQAAAAGVPVPSGIATGQLIRKSSTGWEAVPDRVPVPSGIATGQIIRRTATGWEAYTIPSAPSSGGAATVSTIFINANATNGTWINTGGRKYQWTANATGFALFPAGNKVVGVSVRDPGFTSYWVFGPSGLPDDWHVNGDRSWNASDGAYPVILYLGSTAASTQLRLAWASVPTQCGIFLRVLS